MKKKLILISGTMGAGKSAVCEQLNRLLPASVWLDGDWCWMMDPFVVTEENKRMVKGNIAHLLGSFLGNTSFEHVILSWVMDRAEIAPAVLRKLGDRPFELHQFTLTCSEECLRQRLARDVAAGRRDPACVERAVERLGRYAQLDTIKLDTTRLSARQASERVQEMLGE